MIKLIKISVVTVISSIILFGCAAPITSGTGTSAMTQGDDFSKHLEVHNLKLGKQLKIIDVKSRKTNGLLEINLQLKSTYKKSLKLQYHFNWFDAEGFVIESRKTPWKPLELHGFQSTSLSALAPNEQVASFTVYVRDIPEKAYRY
jgi:uncharacterized protein YcfL